MRITVRQIEGFLAAADGLSFTRAADQLHISQSAFSQLIREMEQALDVRLFDRTTRSVALTDSGRAMAKKLRQGMLMIEEACQDARAVSGLENGHLSVATLPSLAVGCVTQALGDLRRSYPGVTVNLHEGQNPDVLEMLESAKVDLAVCASTPGFSLPKDLLPEALFNEELAAVVLSDHPLARKKKHPWTALQNEPLILMSSNSSTREPVCEALRLNNMDDRPAYEVASLFTALSMVRAGLGITIMPLTALNEVNFSGLSKVRLSSPVTSRGIVLCRRKERLPSPAALWFADALKQRVEASLIASE